MTADKNSRILAEKSSKKTQPQTAFKEISETRSPTLDGETRFNHLRGDPLIIRCREIYDIARQAETTIRELLKSVTYRQGLYRFKSRLKSPKSIWQKVHRNRFEGQRLRDQYQNWLLDPGGDQKDLRVKREQEVRELEKFGPENVLDAFACRYVTLFEEQRLAVVRTLFELLDGFKVPAAEHVPVTLVNCSIYYTTAALGSEDRAKEIIELLSNADFAPRVIQDRSVVKPPINRDGYSSAHFNFELPVIVDFPRGDHPQNPSQPFLERARFEVQVRDIFEEAWSEAEHFLFYRQKDEFRLPNETEAMAKKLVDVHRRSIDATRSYMSEVKQQLDRARGSKEPNLSVKSTTTRLDDKAEIESILRGRVSSTILDILGRAYLLLHEAEEAATVDEGSRKYAEAATVFELLRRELGDANELRMIAKGGRPIRYFINMELANSLIFSGKSDGSSVARGMYEELAKDYPNDPTLRLRYARAISLQDSLSREEVDQALNLMKDFPRLVKADALTGPSHWLTIAGSTLHGYIYYVSFGMYQKDNRRAEALGELEAAITVTRQAAAFWRGLPDWLQRDETYRVSVFKATSNLIYYLALLLAMGGGGSEGFNRQAISDQIRENESIVVERLQDSYKSLANRMCGWVAIGEHEKAVSLAREIYGTLERYAASRAGRPVDFHEIGNYMKGAEAVDFNHVVNVVISQGRKWT
jgi:ppGpp synthetase/RelA/SpoT-type nucleotidyltranferase